jgi:hypothetical protein
MTPIRAASPLLAHVARADVIRRGGVQVNVHDRFQGNAKVAVDPSGGFVVVWRVATTTGRRGTDQLSGSSAASTGGRRRRRVPDQHLHLG